MADKKEKIIVEYPEAIAEIARQELEKIMKEPQQSIALPETLVSFNDGSYKKVKHREWKHSQWIHFTKENGKQVHVNPLNVNYLEDL